MLENLDVSVGHHATTPELQSDTDLEKMLENLDVSVGHHAKTPEVQSDTDLYPHSINNEMKYAPAITASVIVKLQVPRVCLTCTTNSYKTLFTWGQLSEK